MNGIMSGIEDRKNYANGPENPAATPVSAGDRYKEIYDKYAQPTIDPLGKYLIQSSLQGFSENRGGSTLGNLGLAFGGEKLNTLFSDIEGQRTGKRDMELAKLGYDIDEEERQKAIAREDALRAEDIGIAETTFIRENEAKIAAEKLKGENADARLLKELQNNIDVAKIKSKTTGSSPYQKDYSSDRKQFELYKQYTDPRLSQFTTKIQQDFPTNMADYGSYIKQAAEENGVRIVDIVPYQKKGKNYSWNFDEMIPGGLYFKPDVGFIYSRDPENNVLIEYDPRTFKEIRKIPLNKE